MGEQATVKDAGSVLQVTDGNRTNFVPKRLLPALARHPAIRRLVLEGATEVAMSEPGDKFTDDDGVLCTRDHWTGVYRSDFKVEAGFYAIVPLPEEAP